MEGEPGCMTPATGVLAAPPDARLDEDQLHLLSLLDRHGVQHVVLGAAPAAVCVVPAPYARNLDRAAAAVRELGAELPVDPLRSPEPHVFRLTTGRGELQLANAAPDGRRYGELLLDTVPREVRPGLTVEVSVPEAGAPARAD